MAAGSTRGAAAGTACGEVARAGGAGTSAATLMWVSDDVPSSSSALRPGPKSGAPCSASGSRGEVEEFDTVCASSVSPKVSGSRWRAETLSDETSSVARTPGRPVSERFIFVFSLFACVGATGQQAETARL